MHICLRAPYLTRFSVQKIPPKGVCHNTQQEYRLIPICTLHSAQEQYIALTCCFQLLPTTVCERYAKDSNPSPQYDKSYVTALSPKSLWQRGPLLHRVRSRVQSRELNPISVTAMQRELIKSRPSYSVHTEYIALPLQRTEYGVHYIRPAGYVSFVKISIIEAPRCNRICPM